MLIKLNLKKSLPIILIFFLFFSLTVLASNGGEGGGGGGGGANGGGANGGEEEKISRPLEIIYPQFGPEEFEVPSTVDDSIPEYVRYIFFLIIGISGLFAFGSLTYGGFRWMTSADNVEKLIDAKEQITAAIIGMIILLSSWMILNTLNPQLVILEEKSLIPGIPELPTGVWLCKADKKAEMDEVRVIATSFNFKRKGLEGDISEEQRDPIIAELEKLSEEGKTLLKNIYEECYLVNGSGPIKRGFDNKARYWYSVDKRETEENEAEFYGLVLFEDPNYEGNIQFSTGFVDYSIFGVLGGKIIIDPPSSIMVFRLNPEPDPNWQVMVYEEQWYNQGFEGKYADDITENCGGSSPEYFCGQSLDPPAESIKIVGEWLAIFSKEASPEGWREKSAVYVNSSSNLLDNKRITEEESFLGFYRRITVSAANEVIIISGSLY